MRQLLPPSRGQGVKPLPIESPLTNAGPAIIPGLLKRHGLHLLVGEHEVGKSLAALEICHAALTGDPLWGALPVDQPIDKVTYILGEHDTDQIKELWRLTGLAIRPESLFVVGPEYRQTLVQRGVAWNPARTAYQAATTGSGLIVFDPLSAFAAGAEGENDNLGMREVINVMGDIARPSQAAVLILHHMGKPILNPRTGQYSHPPNYASRGASSIEDSTVGCFYMTINDRGEYKFERNRFKAEYNPSYFLCTREGYRHQFVKRGESDQEKHARLAKSIHKPQPPPTADA